MPTFAPGYVPPGFYVQQQDISTPNITPGIRIAAIIGQGAKTLVRQETLTKGAVNGEDGPLSNNTVIQLIGITDQDNVQYTLGRDFKIARNAGNAYVDWSLKASLTASVDLTTLTPSIASALDGKVLRLVVNGGTGTPGDQYITFSAAQLSNAASVATFINSWHPSLVGVASINADNELVLTANSITVDEGNANVVLGFNTGASAEVLEPATGKTYQVTYTSDKVSAEYVPRIFTNMNAVVAAYGEKRKQVVFDSGTASGSGSKTMSDASKTWTTDEWVGFYVKITAGTGKGQVRVVISNTATQLTLSQDWTNLLAPDNTSEYSITDVNDNSISMGCQVAVDTGATVYIASQYSDDIFNDTNIKAAISALAEDVSGFRPYSLTLMRGLGSTEVDPINYLKNFVVQQSNTLHNRWMCATFGLARGNDDFTTYVTIATGTKNERMILVNISEVERDFGFGTVLLDGSYVAAACAGIICANEDAGAPVTRRSIGNAFSVAAFKDPFLVTEKNLMAAAGVTIFERRGTDLVLRDDLSTDPSTIKKKYWRFLRMEDFVSDFLKTRLEDLTVGQRFVVNSGGSADVINNTKANLNFLFSFLTDPRAQIVSRVEDLSVTQDHTDPTQLDIQASIYLTPEVKYVFALLGFGV